MLYLIPILTYDANSVIFTFKMKSPIATNLPRKFSFQKVQGDLDCEEARFQVANRDLTGFHQRVLLATKKAIWGSFIKMPSNASSRALTGIGLTGIGQTEEDQHTAVTPVNIKCHGRTGSEIPGPATLNPKSDGNSENSKSDGNNIDILPFWAASQLSQGIWRASESLREPQRASEGR